MCGHKAVLAAPQQERAHGLVVAKTTSNRIRVFHSKVSFCVTTAVAARIRIIAMRVPIMSSADASILLNSCHLTNTEPVKLCGVMACSSALTCGLTFKVSMKSDIVSRVM